MDINITLVIQSINFIIAYGIIRTFLLKPAMQTIKKEQRQQEGLHIAIRQQEEFMLLKGNERGKNWQICRAYFKDHRPAIEQFNPLADEFPEIVLPKLSTKFINQLVEETQNALIKKIGRIDVSSNNNFYF